MGVKDYSTTASENDAAGSVNFAENQLPSTLNNSMRQVLADIREHLEDGGFFNYGHTTAYASGTSFTIASTNVTAIYAVGRRIRAVGSSTGTIYGVITASAFSTNTTVTVSWDSGSLSSETLAISVSILDANGHVDAAKINSGTLSNDRLDADIKAIANLTSAADKIPYFTGSGTAAVADFTSAGRALLDDANAAAQLTTLGALPLAGGTMTGDLTLAGAPDSNLKAATKLYVDNVAGSATAAATSATLASNYAIKVNGEVESGTYSAKAWAVGGTGITDTSSAGAAKEWATNAEDDTVAGAGTFSALHYSAKASAQATAAASSASAAASSATTATAAAQGWSAVVTLTSGTHNVETTNARTYYLIDASSGTVTINLPAIGSSDGILFGFQVHNVDNAITIVRDGTDRINGAESNYSGLNAVGQVIHFIGDDASPDNWLATIISQVAAASATSSGVVELATNAETATGSDSTRAVTPAAAASAYVAQGTHTIWVPAAAMRPTVSNGCAAITDVETTAGRPDLQVLDFDKDSDEHAQFQIAMPKSWNEGTITFKCYWVGLAATTGVAFGLQGVAVGDNEEADQAYGTAVVVTDDSQGDATEVLVTATSGAVTIANSPAAEDICFFRIFRDVSDSNDDMAGDARLLGVKIFYTVNAKDDS